MRPALLIRQARFRKFRLRRLHRGRCRLCPVPVQTDSRSGLNSGLAMNLRTEKGFTLIELIVASAILAILSLAALPLARVQLRRAQEKELRIALREIRTAIDKYKDSSDKGFIQKELDSEGYPKDLDVLVEG